MQYIYFSYLFIGFFVIQMIMFFDLIYCVQLSGYKISSIFAHLWRSLCDNYLNIFLSLIIMAVMFVLNIQSDIFYLLYLIIEICLFLYAYNKFEISSKLRFTKRVNRIILVKILIGIITFIIMLFMQYKYLTILFPFIYIYNYLVLILSLIILIPVEKIIGVYYINKAKKTLSKNKKIIKIGITGSYGKTSTKEILNSILSEEYYTLATPASFNTPFGISKTINEKLKNTHEVFICEMGAKKRGEIKYLCNMIVPTMGIVTAVGRQHTNTFGSIENIYRTKRELPDSLFGKFCVFNLENYYVNQMYREFIGEKTGVFILRKRKIHSLSTLKKKKILHEFKLQKTSKYFEFPKKQNVYAKNIVENIDFVKFDIYRDDSFVCSAKTQLIGIHNVLNILMSVAIAIKLGVKSDSICRGIAKLTNIHARLEKNIGLNGAIVINNGYNSNLDSAKYSLAILRIFDNPNKLVVTPGLIECENDYKYNFEFGKLLSKYATEVIVVKRKNRQAIVDGLKSANFNLKNVYCVADFSSAKKVIDNLKDDYVVLIENDLPDNFK